MTVRTPSLAAAVIGSLALLGMAMMTLAQDQPSSYAPVVIKEDFKTTLNRMKAKKPEVMARQKVLLEERYDLSNRPAKDVTMTGGKPVQEGVRVKLPAGMTWEKLAEMTPDEIKAKDLWPKGFFPDRKSTRLNSSHHSISYAVFCLKKKKKKKD